MVVTPWPWSIPTMFPCTLKPWDSLPTKATRPAADAITGEP